MITPARRTRNVGEYYFSRKLAEVRGLDTPELPVINLGIGSPDLAPSSETIETLVESARLSTSHAYQSYRGIPRLRNAMARFHSDVFGVDLNADSEILPLMGSKEGILHITTAFVDEGDEVLIPDPGYPTYASVTKLVGGTPRTYRLREELDWGIDLDELERSDLSRVKVMWINFPHMPTGRAASRAELERLLDIAKRNEFLLVNDNPYVMLGGHEPLSILSFDGARDVALELGSLSKSHNMAGWRVGWVAGSPEHVDLVLRVRSNMDSGMFLPVQLAAARALESGKDWFDQLNATYAERRHEANEILRELGCSFVEDQSGLFVWAKAPDSIDDVEIWLDAILHETHVFITPGFIFGEAGRRFVRISLCNPIETLREAKARIEAFSSQSRTSRPTPSRVSQLDTTLDEARLAPAPRVTIIGLGLIGGSIAIDLRKAGFTSHITGIDANPENSATALSRGLIDEIGSLEGALPDSDVVILAIPVDDIESLTPEVLDLVGDRAVVIDAGSTKQSICASIAGHPRRAQFVAAHPIAGTENSGPEAAFSGLFRNKINIFCDRERSSENALGIANEVFTALGMRSVFMGPREHDLHLAYVSHLSHVTSFVLGQTVLDIENDEKSIFLLAGSGFASTVRLAKSSPAMWAPIFDRNGSFLTKALDEYIVHLQRFRQALADRDVDRLRLIMTEANDIRRVLSTMEDPRNNGTTPAPASPHDLAAQTSADIASAIQTSGDPS